MLIFKTSGDTFDSVVKNKRHAFFNKPKSWKEDDIVLICKKKNACKQSEGQIQYVMRLADIKYTDPKDFEKLWPGNKYRWKYLVSFSKATKLEPFNIIDIVGAEKKKHYDSVQTFGNIKGEDENKIYRYLSSVGAI